MKQILLNLFRKLAYYFLNLTLKKYKEMADEDRNGELSLIEIKKSITQLVNIISKFRKKV